MGAVPFLGPATQRGLGDHPHSPAPREEQRAYDSGMQSPANPSITLIKPPSILQKSEDTQPTGILSGAVPFFHTWLGGSSPGGRGVAVSPAEEGPAGEGSPGSPQSSLR